MTRRARKWVRGQLLRAAVGFAGYSMRSYDRSSTPSRTWLDSWSGIGHVTRGHGAPGLRPPTHPVRREGMARDVLHDRDGAFAHECDGHELERTPVACGAEGAWEALKKSETS